MLRSSRINVLSSELDRREHSLGYDDVELLEQTGQLSLPDALPLRSLAIIRGECKRLMDSPTLLNRRIDEDGWDKVTKTTLFRKPQTLPQWAHSLPLHSPEISRTQVWADDLVHKVGMRMFRTNPRTAQQLLNQNSNRAVINRMAGSQDSAAFLGVHIDPPLETGVNVVIALDDGFDTHSGQFVDANTVTVYACADASEEMGIDQTPHGMMSYGERFSLVFTNFVETPHLLLPQ